MTIFNINFNGSINRCPILRDQIIEPNLEYACVDARRYLEADGAPLTLRNKYSCLEVFHVESIM